MILLCLIGKKETYGYEIITELNQIGGRVMGYAKEGTVYPILYRLETAGLIQCRREKATSNGSIKKYYSLTDEGTETLNDLLNFWSDYVDCVDQFIKFTAKEEKQKIWKK